MSANSYTLYTLRPRQPSAPFSSPSNGVLAGHEWRSRLSQLPKLSTLTPNLLKCR